MIDIKKLKFFYLGVDLNKIQTLEEFWGHCTNYSGANQQGWHAIGHWHKWPLWWKATGVARWSGIQWADLAGSIRNHRLPKLWFKQLKGKRAGSNQLTYYDSNWLALEDAAENFPGEELKVD
jgi:hypothetical protein